MPLIYSFVARGPTVLADYTPHGLHGNFSTVAVECLQNVRNPETKFTINCDRHTFNFLNDDDFTFLVVADEGYGRQIPFVFLDRVAEEFRSKFGAKARGAAAGSLEKQFGPRLKHHMEYCEAHPEEISKVAAVQRKVDEVKNIMVENIEKVLERGEKIELLVDKTDDLRFQAEKFHKTGKHLRSKMWWQNFKMKIMLCIIIMVVILIIVLLICFPGGACKK
ncbi:unnamed protein product [Ostreobium quekettii]|uniref:Uncharacterized protein n=1 Tax=Ostreobium quekettii TaxID=121088 RepID=A0A8S1J1J6_9CHLO|nr:unnamed protein product [Ostreobium quekettii]|eukprot:evm.model.scf_226EXC.9 EVM.evm.TU.scf_226EXC.9   scf_226EXC:55505-56790(+)